MLDAIDVLRKLGTQRQEGQDSRIAARSVHVNAHDGNAFRMLTVINEFTREGLAIVAAHNLRSGEVFACLTGPFTRHGSPEYIRSDNASEFAPPQSANGCRGSG